MVADCRGSAGTDHGPVERRLEPAVANRGAGDRGASAARTRVEDKQPGLGGPSGGGRGDGLIPTTPTRDPRGSADRDRAADGRVRAGAGATGPRGRSTARGRRPAVVALRPLCAGTRRGPPGTR